MQRYSATDTKSVPFFLRINSILLLYCIFLGDAMQFSLPWTVSQANKVHDFNKHGQFYRHCKPVVIRARVDLFAAKDDLIGVYFERDRKIEAPCHSRCIMIKTSPCSKGVRADTGLGCFPFTSPRRQRCRQTQQRLFTLPKSPAGDALSIHGNSSHAGDTGFAS